LRICFQVSVACSLNRRRRRGRFLRRAEDRVRDRRRWRARRRLASCWNGRPGRSDRVGWRVMSAGSAAAVRLCDWIDLHERWRGAEVVFEWWCQTAKVTMAAMAPVSAGMNQRRRAAFQGLSRCAPKRSVARSPSYRAARYSFRASSSFWRRSVIGHSLSFAGRSQHERAG